MDQYLDSLRWAHANWGTCSRHLHFLAEHREKSGVQITYLSTKFSFPSDKTTSAILVLSTNPAYTTTLKILICSPYEPWIWIINEIDESCIR